MKFTKRKLSNGITVLWEERDLPVVSLGIANPFGASYEDSKVKGIAHFIEHLVFTGTKTRTHEDISREIEKKGGILNAFTANDVTCFWFKLPSEHVFIGLDILRDIMVNPKFDEAKFEKEKKVILEEIKMYHDNPASHVHEKIVENLYGKPFGEGIIGSKETIKPLTRDFVKEYYETNYGPGKYIVTIVGKVNIEEVCKYLEKGFNKEVKALPKIDVKKINKETVEERPGLDQAHFLFGVHAPALGTKEMYALEVLDAYLANGMSSRLFLKIREEKGLAYTVKGSIAGEKNYAYYTIYAGTTKESVPEIKKIILEEFDNVISMTEKDLAEAKERLIGLRKISKEESAEVMNELLFAEIAGKAEDYYNHEKEIEKVTLEEVKKVALIEKYSTAMIIPK